MTSSTQFPSIGIHRGVADDTYHAFDAASSSRLKLLDRSPAHLRAELDEPKSYSWHQKLGIAAHAAILTPMLFDRDFTMLPAGHNARTKAGKALQQELAERYGEMRVLKRDEHAACIAMRKAVLAHKEAGRLLKLCPDREVSLVANMPTGNGNLLCKARFDAVSFGSRMIVDIKTTKDAQPEAFGKSAWNYGYYRQAAFYMHMAAALGQPIEQYYIIAVEKEAPYAVSVHSIGDDLLQFGWAELQEMMNRYAECLHTNEWPGYVSHAIELPIPHWAKRVMAEAGHYA